MKSLRILALISVLFVSHLSFAQNSKAIEAPKLMVVKFHADWCRICRAMGPVF